MIGRQDRSQRTLFMPGSLDQLVPDDHTLKRVDKVLDLSWLRKEVRDCYDDTNGRPRIDTESAVRLMLAGFFWLYLWLRRCRKPQSGLVVELRPDSDRFLRSQSETASELHAAA